MGPCRPVGEQRKFLREKVKVKIFVCGYFGVADNLGTVALITPMAAKAVAADAPVKATAAQVETKTKPPRPPVPLFDAETLPVPWSTTPRQLECCISAEAERVLSPEQWPIVVRPHRFVVGRAPRMTAWQGTAAAAACLFELSSLSSSVTVCTTAFCYFKNATAKFDIVNALQFFDPPVHNRRVLYPSGFRVTHGIVCWNDFHAWVVCDIDGTIPNNKLSHPAVPDSRLHGKWLLKLDLRMPQLSDMVKARDVAARVSTRGVASATSADYRHVVGVVNDWCSHPSAVRTAPAVVGDADVADAAQATSAPVTEPVSSPAIPPSFRDLLPELPFVPYVRRMGKHRSKTPAQAARAKRRKLERDDDRKAAAAESAVAPPSPASFLRSCDALFREEHKTPVLAWDELCSWPTLLPIP